MKNLSGIKTSMTYVLEHNLKELNACTSVAELSKFVSELFAENNINTPASKRLITNISRNRDLGSAQLTVYNSILCGGNLAVIK